MSKYEMSANAAAAEIRHKILRKMRELETTTKDGFGSGITFAKWNTLKEYIKGMAKRASKKKGGLGRK